MTAVQIEKTTEIIAIAGYHEAQTSAKSHPIFFTFFELKKLEKFTKAISSVNLGKLCPVHMQDEWSFVSPVNLGKTGKDTL